MTDNLRDRIAKAIYDSSDEYTRKLMVRPDCPGASDVEGEWKPVCYRWADAVIRELVLHREIVTESLTDPRTGSGPTERTMYRYVTEWTTDE